MYCAEKHKQLLPAHGANVGNAIKEDLEFTMCCALPVHISCMEEKS